ncbi:prepilin-type N-terminal cleavage/methylation domain-containing protein [Pseudomonas sp. F1_0610]|uniref:pilus assembly FimT family protein n=1 Tax=Pseudomonas sp. F1_0610 TaxID=3114284 RepID=UPI0039C30B09
MLSKRVNGFTLIELLTVIALIGIVASLAMPSFTQFISKNKTEAAANDISSLVRKARRLAVLNAKTIRVSVTNTGFEIKDQKDIPNMQAVIPEGIKFKKNNIGTDLYFNRKGLLSSADGVLLTQSSSISFCSDQVSKEVKIKSSMSVEVATIDNKSCN